MADDPEDDDFTRAMADVAPLKGVSRDPSVAAKSSPTSDVAQTHRRAAAMGLTTPEDANTLTLGEVPAVAPQALLEWKKDGVQQAVFGKLRNGHYRPDAQLDLHGLTVKEARAAVYELLHKAEDLNYRSLLIAHGRGEKSATPARLKSYLAYWLQHWPEVIAYHSALPRQGGTGALYVLLKKPKRKKEETRELHGQKSDSGQEW